MSVDLTHPKKNATSLPSTDSLEGPSNGPRKRILVLCPYPVGVAAGQRLKYEQYIEHWRSSGYDVDIAPFMDMAMWKKLYVSGHTLAKAIGTFKGYLRRCRDLFRIRSYDGIYIFMWITPLGTSMFERLALRLGRKVIYDVEDNIFVETGNELNRFAKLLKSPRKTTVLVRNADHVITSSPVLNDYCKKINTGRSCTFVTSSVDAARYVAAKRQNNSGPVVIGWTGTFTSKRFLDMLRTVLLKLKERRDFKLLVIGNFDYDFPEINCEVVRWKKETEIEDLQRIDIGVYPLPQEDWVLGKSGLKVIQYMAMSLPTVSTNYGTAQEIISHGDNGFLANTEDEWVEQLVQLIDNQELRQKLGTAARQTVEERYSTEVVKQQYLQVLKLAFG
jgi:glycosyltransferase involved in cell wall biosynthesis